jgi:hypothetical protein
MSDIIRGLGNLFSKFGRGPEVSDTTSRTFAVSGAPTVDAHNTIGSVRVVTAGDGAVRVDATRKARGITGDAMQSDLERITVTFAQDGDTIRVDARLADRTVLVARQIWCDLVIAVPVATQLDLKMEAGNVEIGGVRGNLTAKVDAGNLEVKGASGQVVATVNAGQVDLGDASLSGASRVRVDAGQIALAGALAAGATLDLRVSAGRIKLTLPAGTSARFEASTDVGAISVSGWPIAVSRNITAAHAAGNLGPSPSGSISARVDIGDITVTAR